MAVLCSQVGVYRHSVYLVGSMSCCHPPDDVCSVFQSRVRKRVQATSESYRWCSDLMPVCFDIDSTALPDPPKCVSTFLSG